MIRTVPLALLVLVGCETAPDPASPPAGGDAVTTSEETPRLLTDRVWMRSDLPDLPGSARVFLSNGTLLMDSCWETYRLEAWTAEADSAVRWQEDGQDVRASVVSLTDDGLVLRVNGETQEYAAASAPYLCPDMPR